MEPMFGGTCGQVDGHSDKWSSELVIEAEETMKQSKEAQGMVGFQRGDIRETCSVNTVTELEDGAAVLLEGQL